MYVFTTRADTLMGVTFCAVAPEHPLAAAGGPGRPGAGRLHRRMHKGGSTTEAELALQGQGRPRTGLTVTHPLTGEAVPLWVGNYVLMGYGDGAVMGVPAHDERDFAFAQQVRPADPAGRSHVDGETFDSTRLAGLVRRQGARALRSTPATSTACRTQATVDAVAARWRPRAWARRRPPGGCATGASAASATGARRSRSSTATRCGACRCPRQDLPVMLPEDLVPDGSGNPLNKCAAFLHVACPQCGKPARRETDTMDTFVDCAWYYMRYTCPDNDDAMVDARNDYWMPMDQYIGGIEHAVLHLLYARFWTKAMRDLGLVKFGEPFTRLFTQGMLRHGVFLPRGSRRQEALVLPQRGRHRARRHGRTGRAPRPRPTACRWCWAASRRCPRARTTCVEPQDIIARFGADTARLFVMFAGPPDQSAAWSDSRRRGRLPLPAPRLDLGAAPARRSSPRRHLDRRLQRSRARPASQLHELLRQVTARLRAHAVQHRGLGRDEDAQRAGGRNPDRQRGRRRGAREGCRHPAAHAVPGRAAHRARAVAARWGSARATASCSTRPGRWSTRRRWCASEIELVLQVGGKLRGASRVPADGRQGHDRGGGAGEPRCAALHGRQAGAQDRRRAGPAGQRRRLNAGAAPRCAAAAGGPGRPAAFGCAAPTRCPFRSIALVGFAPRFAVGRGAARTLARQVQVAAGAGRGRGRAAGAGGPARAQRRGLHRRRPGARTAAAPAGHGARRHARRPRADGAGGPAPGARAELHETAALAKGQEETETVPRDAGRRRRAAAAPAGGGPSSEPTPMQIRPEQLAAHLQRGLRPLYTVHGDEPLLAQEAGDAIRAAARAAGLQRAQGLHRQRRAFRLEPPCSARRRR